MHYLHSQGIVHGDLNPVGTRQPLIFLLLTITLQRNVLVGKNFQVKIADFAMARVKFSVTVSNDATQAGTEGGILLPGTRAFMAPERLTRGTTGFSTDVYAYGMTCYQVSMFHFCWELLLNSVIQGVCQVTPFQRCSRGPDL